MLSADPLPQSDHRADCADNATGFRINPLSCTSPLGHPRLRCGLGFKRLGHEPSWRLSRRNFPIARLAPKDCEGNARHLVGERHGDEVERLLLDELLRPCAQRIRMGFTMKQHGMRPTTSNLRKYRLPIFEIRPSRCLPPEEFCLGVRPRKAANSLGPEKLDAS